MKSLLALLLLVAAFAAGMAFEKYFTGKTDPNDDAIPAAQTDTPGKREPLYWVAPMDPNYRRDKPGKSPMGMDLVPVYEEDDKGGAEGSVKISPMVVNNLGVRVAGVQSGPLAMPIKTVGYVAFDEERLLHIHGRVDGWIERLYASSEGDSVRKGQTLYELFSPTLVNAQEEFLAVSRSGSQQLKEASRLRLLSLGLSESQINALERRGRVDQRIKIAAEQDGIVNQLNVRQGMYVKPATEIMSIGSLDTVWVIAEVFERQANWVRPGQRVEMYVAAMPGELWEGKVDYLYPVLDSKTRTLRVRLRFPNPKLLLKPNMYADITIFAEVSEDTLSIPSEALIRGERFNRVVVRLDEGVFKSKIVSTGQEAGGRVQILEGLVAGDRVVTSAQFLIDSESNIDAELARMEARDGEAEAAVVTATGTIREVFSDKAMLNIDHEPIDVLGWPAMRMDFKVAQTVDVDSLQSGQTIDFELSKQGESGYVVTAVKARSAHGGGHDHGSHQHPPGAVKMQPEDSERVAATGEVRKLMPEMDKVEIVHDPIPEWKWPAMTMSFTVADPAKLESLTPGQRIRFTLTKTTDGDYLLSNPEPTD